MNDLTLSSSALQLVEMIQQSPVLRPIVEDRPDLLAVFIRSADIAARMSSDRTRILEAVSRAADASDRVVEAIRDRNVVELAERLIKAAHEIESLGEALKDFSPAVAVSRDVGTAPN